VKQTPHGFCFESAGLAFRPGGLPVVQQSTIACPKTSCSAGAATDFLKFFLKEFQNGIVLKGGFKRLSFYFRLSYKTFW